MARKNQTAGKTANNTVTTNPVLGDIRVTLAAARKCNNKKAISRDFAAGNPYCKNPDKVFEAWCHAVAEIYKVIEPWATGFNSAEVTDETLQAIYEAVIPMWTALATDVDPKMFVRTNDVHRLLSFSLKHGATYKGSVDVAVNLTNFRREVETMMGIRLAQSAILTEDEYSLVTAVDKTQANLEKAQDRLNGYIAKDGTAKPGLKAQLETAKATLAEMTEMAIKLGVPKEQTEDHALLTSYRDAVADLESAISKTEKKIADYITFIKDNSKAYNAIMDKINDIDINPAAK